MTSYFVHFYCYKSCWRQKIFKFSIEIERGYQEYSKNVVFDNFHQLNWKWWLVMLGFGARDELALAVACWFWPFVVMWWACVCLGLGQCFWGSPECAGDGCLGIIDLLQTESLRNSSLLAKIIANLQYGFVFVISLSNLWINQFQAWPSLPVKKKVQNPDPAGTIKTSWNLTPEAFSSIIHYKNMKKWDRNHVKLQNFIIFRWLKISWASS